MDKFLVHVTALHEWILMASINRVEDLNSCPSGYGFLVNLNGAVVGCFHSSGKDMAYLISSNHDEIWQRFFLKFCTDEKKHVTEHSYANCMELRRILIGRLILSYRQTLLWFWQLNSNKENNLTWH